MLLRRITLHVKTQNWFAVFLDFFIVVIGVYIGLQVNNWNGARQTLTRQDTVLSQLAEELDDAVHEAEKRVAFQQRILVEIDVVIATTDSGKIDPEDEVQFSSGLNLLNGWWQPAWRLATVDELISQGELNLIPDPKLRSGLVAYRDTVDVIRDDIILMLGDNSTFMPFISRHIRSVPNGFESVAETEEETANAVLFDFTADLPALKADTEARGAMDAIRRNQTYILLNQITIRAEAIRLREQLKGVRK